MTEGPGPLYLSSLGDKDTFAPKAIAELREGDPKFDAIMAELVAIKRLVKKAAYREPEPAAEPALSPEDIVAQPGSYADKRVYASGSEPVRVEVRNEHFMGVLLEGHEYVLTTQIPGVERAPRYSRMGFMGLQHPNTPGPKYLQFSGRGPDRTHDGRYGGTQVIHERSIRSASEVESEHAKRYVALTREQLAKLPRSTR